MSTEFDVAVSSEREADFVMIARSAHRVFDTDMRKIPNVMIAPDGATMQIACRKGCYFCCSINVTVSASELHLIIGYIRTLPLHVSQNMAERVRQAYTAVKGLSVDQRAKSRTICPLLLQDGSCGVYPARPLVCRGFISGDANACKESYEKPKEEILVPQGANGKKRAEELLSQMMKHERQCGAKPGLYELIQALYIALNNHQSTKELLSGGDPYSAARQRP